MSYILLERSVFHIKKTPVTHRPSAPDTVHCSTVSLTEGENTPVFFSLVGARGKL